MSDGPFLLVLVNETNPTVLSQVEAGVFKLLLLSLCWVDNLGVTHFELGSYVALYTCVFWK